MPSKWLIEVEHLRELFRVENDHMYVMRMYNRRTEKKSLFALYPPEGEAPGNIFDAGGPNELETGDRLVFEIFDHTGVLLTIQHQILATEAAGRHIRLSDELSISPPAEATRTDIGTTERESATATS